MGTLLRWYFGSEAFSSFLGCFRSSQVMGDETSGTVGRRVAVPGPLIASGGWGFELVQVSFRCAVQCARLLPFHFRKMLVVWLSYVCGSSILSARV